MKYIFSIQELSISYLSNNSTKKSTIFFNLLMFHFLRSTSFSSSTNAHASIMFLFSSIIAYHNFLIPGSIQR